MLPLMDCCRRRIVRDLLDKPCLRSLRKILYSFLPEDHPKLPWLAVNRARRENCGVDDCLDFPASIGLFW